MDLAPCSNLNSLVQAKINVILDLKDEIKRDSGGKFVPGDGLEISWENKTVFVNPPFINSSEWLIKGMYEVTRGAEIIYLIPDSPDTKIWKNRILLEAKGRCQIGHRIKFVGMKNTIPKPCSFVYFGKYPDKFKEIFKLYGRVENPSDVYSDQNYIVL